MEDVTVASTTDTQEAINRAVGLPEIVEIPEVVETPEVVSESTEEVDETAPASDTGKTEKKDKGKGRFSKRIDELTRERYEAQAATAAAQEQAAQLREQLAKIQAQPRPEPEHGTYRLTTNAPDGAPKRADYASDEEWLDARVDWRAEQRDKRNAEQERQQRDQSVHATYMERADHFTAEHPDFNEVVNGIRMAPDVAPGVQAAIMGRPNGAEVAYYLGQNPDVCEELSQMNPADAVAEIGAISYELMPKKTSPTPVKRVPAPLTPVGGSSRVAQNLSDIEDTDAWIARRRLERQSVRR